MEPYLPTLIRLSTSRTITKLSSFPPDKKIKNTRGVKDLKSVQPVTIDCKTPAVEHSGLTWKLLVLALSRVAILGSTVCIYLNETVTRNPSLYLDSAFSSYHFSFNQMFGPKRFLLWYSRLPLIMNLNTLAICLVLM